MEKFKLKLEARSSKNPGELRRQGKIPATVYGPGFESECIQVDSKEFSRLPAAAFSHVLELVNGKSSINAIIRKVQRKGTTSEVLNVEFYRVASDRLLTVTVPIRFVGVSSAVQAGGQLVDMYQEVEIECMPGDIPDCVEVDISAIKEVDHGIHFSEITVSPKIKILSPGEEIIVKVVPVRKAATPAEQAKAAEAAKA
jgi:large subunit ribosomal protein L25